MPDLHGVSDVRADAIARLTARDTPFEIVDEQVRGITMPVLRNRHRSLNALLAESARYGDAEYLVCGDLRLTFTEHLARVASLAYELRTRYGVEQATGWRFSPPTMPNGSCPSGLRRRSAQSRWE